MHHDTSSGQSTSGAMAMSTRTTAQMSCEDGRGSWDVGSWPVTMESISRALLLAGARSQPKLEVARLSARRRAFLRHVNSGFLDKLLERIGRVRPEEVRDYV